MNEAEIDEAASRYQAHPLLGPATRTLVAVRNAADANSDGWAYWPAPARAAAKLMQLIEGDDPRSAWWDRQRDDVTPERLRRAYVPLKAFRTRSGLQFEIFEPEMRRDNGRHKATEAALSAKKSYQ